VDFAADVGGLSAVVDLAALPRDDRLTVD
jgi:hypothetical protein